MLRLSTGLLFLLALCGIGSAAAQDNNLDISGALSNLPEEIGDFVDDILGNMTGIFDGMDNGDNLSPSMDGIGDISAIMNQILNFTIPGSSNNSLNISELIVAAENCNITELAAAAEQCSQAQINTQTACPEECKNYFKEAENICPEFFNLLGVNQTLIDICNEVGGQPIPVGDITLPEPSPSPIPSPTTTSPSSETETVNQVPGNQQSSTTEPPPPSPPPSRAMGTHAVLALAVVILASIIA